MTPVLSTIVILSGILFSAAFADNDCKPYFDDGDFKRSISCGYSEFCCGTCKNRYCCSQSSLRLRDSEQDACFFSEDGRPIAIGATIAGVIIFFILIITCCLCPCCCLYQMCRKPRPVVATATHTTTVVSSQFPQPQQPAQYPGYQPMPAQPGYGTPGYGGQPGPTAPYQGQQYTPGPPPPYQEASAGYPAPYSQAAYNGRQLPYPIHPPAQSGFAAQPLPPTDYNPAGQPAYNPASQPAYNPASQPAYNPAYVEPPKTGL